MTKCDTLSPKILKCAIMFYYYESIMKVDSSRLWTRFKEKGIKNKTDLIQMARISTNILAKVNKGEYISMVVS